MLLGGLLAALFARGVTLVATSNVLPDNLYQDGLQRARFLPAIAMLQKHCAIMKLEAAQDFRLRALTQASVYFVGDAAKTDVELEDLLLKLATVTPKRDFRLDVNHRKLNAKAVAGSVAWFNFAELCDSARSAEDYIELAKEFSTVLLSDIPLLGVSGEDSARRFMFLVDEFYDRRIKLILAAVAAPDQLYRGHKFQMEFQRTISRLIEMQSQEYLAERKRG
jgi:cell division protein ZapE